MSILEIEAKTILRKYKKIDSWFLSRYGMNLYRGCTHGCIYCDGRDEKYGVEGRFDKDIAVKVNAPDILRKELTPGSKRKIHKSGFVFLGGGVNDSYQPVEQNYQITRKALHLLKEYSFPVHVLTKSVDVRNDADVLAEINQKTKAIISFSFSTTNEKLAKMVEPHAPSPAQRLNAISWFKDRGFSCGAYLMPVLPFLSDDPEQLEQSFSEIKNAGADFIVPAGLTLKQGRQKDHYLKVIETRFPHLQQKYSSIYTFNSWGSVSAAYADQVNLRFFSIAKKQHISLRIPLDICKNYVDETDKIVVMLEHMDYMLSLQGKKSSFGYAAYAISQLNRPVREMKLFLQQIKGVGEATEKIMQEILETGTSTYHDKLMNFG